MNTSVMKQHNLSTFFEDTAKRVWNENRPLALTGIALLVSLAITIIGIFVDPRVITGQPAWLKPAKFAISLAIYAFTALWMLSFIEGRQRIKQIIIWGIIVTLWIEFGLIAMQAFRGTTSHFNAETPFDMAVYATMAIAVVGLWFTCFGLAGLFFFQNLKDKAFSWGMRIGLVGSIIGMGMAFTMTIPNQFTDVGTPSDGSTIIGAHSIGVDDGGPGLPIVGWSTEGGDLRVSHFIGLHAMQAVPILAMILATIGVADNHRLRFVIIGGFAYIAITFLTYWQALRGQSVIAPDLVTLTALAVVLLVSTLGIILTLRQPAHYGFGDA
ncbi:MAG: hypothetical protein AAFN11_17555 [Chloroflexota bacterium]